MKQHIPRMARFSLLVFLCILSARQCAHADIIAGPILDPLDGFSYYLLSSADWTDSESEAVSLGGNLATITSLADNEWVFNTFDPLASGTTVGLWIGLNDAAESGTYVWSSGASDTFTNWYSGEPNNIGLEHYTYMVGTEVGAGAGEWNNLQDFAQNGSTTLYGVAEVATVPEPSSVVLALLCVPLLSRFRRLVN